MRQVGPLPRGRGVGSGPLQEGHDDRRQQRGQHGHRPQDLAHQGGRGSAREEGLGDDEAEGAEGR